LGARREASADFGGSVRTQADVERGETCSLLQSQTVRRRESYDESLRNFHIAQLERALLDIELCFDWRQNLNMTHPDRGEIDLAEIEGWFFNDREWTWVVLDPVPPVCGARFQSRATASGWYCLTPSDGPTSLAALCDVLNITIGYVRRVVGRWRQRRLAGGSARLVPPREGATSPLENALPPFVGRAEVC
jgi:hypothetical protein